MNQAKQVQFPGGSKTRVTRAGINIREGTASHEDLDVIDVWRAAHRAVLNTFQAILRNRTRGTGITVAQRHKRKRTIFDKLRRFPSMQLARMDDIAGCRMIFKNMEDLYSFREAFHKARFNHKRRNEVDKYDYIKTPKSTGYRSIHDVYEYDVTSAAGRDYTGLFVELQYRTLVQHAWATAVEVIGFITESQPKFQEGDTRYEKAMTLASEILARSFENSTGPLPEIENATLVSDFLELDRELGLMSLLRGLNAADSNVTGNRNVILIFSETSPLEVKTFRDATEALRALFDIEQKKPGHDVVLVRADSSEDVRIAFKNYFSDARDFISMIEISCQKLSGKKVIGQPKAE
ncbi:MAG TPA: RelA/SpoT domain-containing protein [Methylophilaceae bacterium]